MDDLVRRKDVIDALHGLAHRFEDPEDWCILEGEAEFVVSKLPSAQPEPRYTEEELRIFQYGIQLRLLSKRSAQHWNYDEDTAKEIEFLERLYGKVSEDILRIYLSDEQDG